MCTSVGDKGDQLRWKVGHGITPICLEAQSLVMLQVVWTIWTTAYQSQSKCLAWCWYHLTMGLVGVSGRCARARGWWCQVGNKRRNTQHALSVDSPIRKQVKVKISPQTESKQAKLAKMNNFGGLQEKGESWLKVYWWWWCWRCCGSGGKAHENEEKKAEGRKKKKGENKMKLEQEVKVVSSGVDLIRQCNLILIFFLTYTASFPVWAVSWHPTATSFWEATAGSTQHSSPEQ